MEVGRLYKYAEVKTSANEIHFGWATADEFDFNSDYILSYHSRSKFASEDETRKSKDEGNNAASFDDYTKYFKALTGSDPLTFYQKWDEKEDELNAFWKSNFPKNTDERQHLFVLKLARLLTTGKKFVMYSRGYKLVKPNETGDQTTEV